MRTFIRMTLAAGLLAAAAAAPLAAQEVVMNSAETINRGNFKLGVFPVVLFARNGGESLTGVAARAGFGLTPRIDFEAKAAFFRNISYYGADVEFWLLRGRRLNASAALGAHVTDAGGGGDSSGIDLNLMVSTRPANNLEAYAALQLAFDSLKGSGRDVTLARFVPGIEYRLARDLDFLAEFGISLNDNSRHYAGVGLAYYFRR